MSIWYECVPCLSLWFASWLTGLSANWYFKRVWNLSLSQGICPKLRPEVFQSVNPNATQESFIQLCWNSCINVCPEANLHLFWHKATVQNLQKKRSQRLNEPFLFERCLSFLRDRYTHIYKCQGTIGWYKKVYENEKNQSHGRNLTVFPS